VKIIQQFQHYRGTHIHNNSDIKSVLTSLKIGKQAKAGNTKNIRTGLHIDIPIQNKVDLT
jgi:hypothetical protein